MHGATIDWANRYVVTNSEIFDPPANATRTLHLDVKYDGSPDSITDKSDHFLVLGGVHTW